MRREVFGIGYHVLDMVSKRDNYVLGIIAILFGGRI